MNTKRKVQERGLWVGLVPVLLEMLGKQGLEKILIPTYLVA